MRSVIFAVAASAAVVMAAQASAAEYLLTFDRTAQGGYAATGPDSATLDLTVADSPNAAGGFDVLSIDSGSVDGDTVTGLSPDPNPSHPNADYSTDGWFIFDNNLFLSEPHVSNPGLLFVSATEEYNLFSNGPSSYELIQATPHVGYTGDSLGTVSIVDPPTAHFDFAGPLSAAPEPTTWAMLLLGLGGLGAALRMRSRADRRLCDLEAGA